MLTGCEAVHILLESTTPDRGADEEEEEEEEKTDICGKIVGLHCEEGKKRRALKQKDEGQKCKIRVHIPLPRYLTCLLLCKGTSPVAVKLQKSSTYHIVP